jgi:hypothetical protein
MKTGHLIEVFKFTGPPAPVFFTLLIGLIQLALILGAEEFLAKTMGFSS